ncbi:hypothetical protein OC845_006707 [Tilletia horrida]|nr:hypothetical protein OC845_006707 [Tilletia horrida]
MSSSSLRTDGTPTAAGPPDLEMADTGLAVAEASGADDIPMMDEREGDSMSGADEPTLASSYDLSTNPLTVSGYAEALSDCFSAVTSLLSIDDDRTAIPVATNQALLSWAADTGRAVLSEADRLQADIQRAATSLEEDERSKSIETLSKLRFGPQILDLTALTAAESKGAIGQEQSAFLSELSRLEAVFAQSAEWMLANAGPSDIEVLCDLADSTAQLAQLRVRTNVYLSSVGTQTAVADIRAAWATASVAAKMLLRAYALVEALDTTSTPGSGTAVVAAGGGSSSLSGLVLGGHEGRAGLLTERQRAQLSISVSLAQVSLFRLHPLFNILRSQESATDARRTTDTLRANAVAYSRRALQQAGLKWIYQWADDAKTGFQNKGARKLPKDWVLSHAHGIEHEERVLHGGWELLSLRAEALMTAIRAGWYQTLASSAGTDHLYQTMPSFEDLNQLSSEGAEVAAMADCVSALTRRPAQGSHAIPDKALESKDIARAFEAEIFTTIEGADVFATQGAVGQLEPARQVRIAVEIDSSDGSVRGSTVSNSSAAVNELAFWDWVMSRTLGNSS